MNLLFWNTGCRQVNDILVDLIIDTGADLIALAEYQCDPMSLLHALRKRGRLHVLVPSIGCDRITLLATLPQHSVRHRRDADRYTIKELREPGFAPVLLVVLHLPSKLHLTDDDQLMRATMVKHDIEEAEAQCGHRNTLVIGDFNMNPFDKGMMSASAFNALPCARTASRESRTIAGGKFTFFYNPSWNLLGDRNEAPGTFFHRTPSTISHYWNTLDQVIVRPVISDAVDRGSVRTVTVAGSRSLLSSDGLPESSDHLPIALTLNRGKVNK